MKSETNLYKTHKNRLHKFYQQLLEKHKKDCIIIHSGVEEEYFQEDIIKPFKAYSHFLHWIPYNKPNCFLMITCDKTKLYYKIYDDFWHEPVQKLNTFWKTCYDTVPITNDDDFWNSIKIDTNTVYIGATPQLAKSYGIRNINPQNILNELVYFRRLKDEYEELCIEKANIRSLNGHRFAKRCFDDNMSEFEIDNSYLKAIKQSETDTPYPNIVALNDKCGILHYENKRTEVPENHYSLLIDAGATYNSYASDITRTYVANAYENSEYSDLLKKMESLQSTIINKIQIGLSYIKLHEETHIQLSKVLSDTNIIKLDAGEIFERGISRYFMPHGLGHLIGIQVHDCGGHHIDGNGTILNSPKEYPYLRLTQSIEPGHIFTIEPGIYFIDKLLKQLQSDLKNDFTVLNTKLLDELKVFGGIRIEDNISVRVDNIINLTRRDEKF